MTLFFRIASRCSSNAFQRGRLGEQALCLTTLRCNDSFVVPRQCYATNTSHDNQATTKILYDGECAICMLEISVLKRFKRKNLQYVDISLPDYNPSSFNGITYEQAMKEMHVIQGDNIFVKADAIRKMYDSVGLSWLSNFTRLPLVESICDKLYVKFAKYRLKRAIQHCDTSKCSIKLKTLKEEIEGR